MYFSVVRPADHISADTEIVYDGIPNNDKDTLNKLTRTTTGVWGESPCVVSQRCNLSVTADVISTSLKRDTDATVVVKTRLSVSFDFGQLFLDGVLQIEEGFFIFHFFDTEIFIL